MPITKAVGVVLPGTDSLDSSGCYIGHEHLREGLMSV